MNKILICSENEDSREALKLILGDYRELILTDSIEQAKEIVKRTEIEIFFTDKDKISEVNQFLTNTSIKTIAILRPIKKEEILKYIMQES